MNDVETLILVCQARGGDRHAFDQLARRTERMVFAVALRRLGNHAEAQEVTQEVLVQVLCKLKQLRDPERFEPWLRTITRRLAINRATRRPKESLGDCQALGEAPCARSDPLEGVMREEERARLRAVLAQLRDLDRKTLVAFYFENLSLQEMSVRFKSPIGTIKRRLHTARNRLRDRLPELQMVG